MLDGGARPSIEHVFRKSVDAVHVEQPHEARVDYVFLDEHNHVMGSGQSSCLRFLVARPGPNVAKLRLHADDANALRVLEVFDRAHFPTMAVEHSISGSADTPPAPIQPD
jgi:hypothetical protein